jgi:hypothetical protein
LPQLIEVQEMNTGYNHDLKGVNASSNRNIGIQDHLQKRVYPRREKS